MSTKEEPLKQFPGFPPEPVTNYWAYPKALNGWWHALSPTEQKILDYILRHTWGYKKVADAIAISQFIKGITKRDGTIVDKGTGIKNAKTVRKALRGLEQKGFILSEPVVGKESIFTLKVISSQEMVLVSEYGTAPVPNNGTMPLPKLGTYNKGSINNYNTSPSKKESINKETYKEEISFLIDYLSSKLGVRFPNFGKQATYAKSMLGVGFSTEDITNTIDSMVSNTWWAGKGFDMKNVADQITKIKVQLNLKPPKFLACKKGDCENGFIEKVVNEEKIYAKCDCRIDFEKLLENWKKEHE